MKILYGNVVAEKLRENLIARISNLDISPTLATIKVGEDDAILSYENGIRKQAEKLGIKLVSNVVNTERKLCDKILELNRDKGINGILLFKPLPSEFDIEMINNLIMPEKDIDGITDSSFSSIYSGNTNGFIPATAKGVLHTLDYYNLDVSSKNVVVIGRSLVIGKPLAMLLLSRNANVTICHSRTSKKDLRKYLKDADYIFVASGVANMINADDIGFNQVIIDVGIHLTEYGKLVGDVDFDDVSSKVSAITPVPKGIGSVTTLCLLENLIISLENSKVVSQSK